MILIEFSNITEGVYCVVGFRSMGVLVISLCSEKIFHVVALHLLMFLVLLLLIGNVSYISLLWSMANYDTRSKLVDNNYIYYLFWRMIRL